MRKAIDTIFSLKILWLSILLFFASLTAEKILEHYEGKETVSIHHKVQKFVQDTEADILHKLVLLRNIPTSDSFYIQALNLFRDNKFHSFVYENTEPVFWSSDKINFRFFKPDEKVRYDYIQLADGFYKVASIQKNNFSYFVLQKLATHYSIAGTSLPQFELVPSLSIKSNVELSLYSKDSYFIPVLDTKGKEVFYLKLVHSSFGNSLLLFFYVLSFSILLVSILFTEIDKQKKWSHVSFYIFGFFVLIRILFNFNLVFTRFQDTVFFSPEILAYSNFTSSPIDLFLNLFLYIFGSIFILEVFRKSNFNLKKQPYSIILWFIILGLAFLFSFWLVSQIRHLVYDSNINFDPVLIDKIGILSILGLLFIGLYFILFLQVFKLFTFLESKTRPQKPIATLLGTILSMVFIGFVFVKVETLVGLYIVVFLFVLWFLTWSSFKIKNIRKDALLLFIYCLFVSLFLNYFVQQKEKSYKTLYAQKMVNERDLQFEYKLLETEQNLIEDNVVVNIFSSGRSLNYKSINETIKYDYFLDYFRDFEVSVEVFEDQDRKRRSYSKKNLSTLKRYIHLSKENKLGTSFYKIMDSPDFSGYIAEFTSGKPNTDSFKSIYILLRQKVRSSNRLFQDYFEKSNLNANPYDYFFALYAQNQLIRVSPDFPFERTNSKYVIQDSDSSFMQNGYAYYIYKENNNKTIVLVSKQRKWSDLLTIFSFILLSLLLSWLLFISLNYLFKWIHVNKVRKSHFNKRLYLPTIHSMLLSSKIRTALLLELIISFIIGSILVVNFLKSNYNEIQKKQTLEKVKSISVELEKTGFVFGNRATGAQREYLISLGESYNTDINIFDKEGVLILTSNNNLLNKGLINNLINPDAYLQLIIQKLFSYNQEEVLGGIKYNSYYQAILNSEQELMGYIHMPYFAGDKEANKEITSLILNISNVFVLFLFVTGFFAIILSGFITKPLKMINVHLKRLRLDRKMEQIAWDGKDELGQLVHTYNEVVKKLEISIDKLAQSEREGAWKEMAKQVAHEIKNPLTPMKLSVQHLQRSALVSGQDLQANITKVANLLITQIDSLSKMADEFSNFAKMPEPKYEVVELSKLVIDTIKLYEKTDQTQITFYNSIGSDGRVLLDEFHFQRVLINLIKNAIQAKQADKQIEIEIYLDYTDNKEGVLIKVKDNGVGIAEAEKQNIFRPNFSTKSSGMGLGLAISKKTIELSKGTIYFESKLGEGTIFFIELPLCNNKEN
jgi:two-component system, NtrC family, nitrogen regulation sensor histidine kinase NtrY